MKAKRSDKGANALLGDLESIRTLLSEEEKAAQTDAEPMDPIEPEVARPSAEAEQPAKDDMRVDDVRVDDVPADDVPVLEDVVEGGAEVDEPALEETPALEPEPVPEPPPEPPQASAAAEAPQTSQQPESAEEESPVGLDDSMFEQLLGDDWRQAAAELLDDARASIEAHSQQWTPEDTDELNEALQVRIDETLHRWLRQTVQERMDDLRAELLTAIGDQLEATVKRRFNEVQPGDGPHGK